MYCDKKEMWIGAADIYQSPSSHKDFSDEDVTSCSEYISETESSNESVMSCYPTFRNKLLSQTRHDSNQSSSTQLTPENRFISHITADIGLPNLKDDHFLEEKREE
ncbi:unnamed protein product [Acanthoscelides obtectus]|uniref:Uncharacterized protein n=1 Tax=Acanthoscelides obtectus TaxID=200917 RepID=A0A9P0MFX9_ACAOB|nr:unnamed protein product [Acanthoscelides obtectus]CAK1670816.1 hypothetical protein AOBTE_LOCUS27850 [Acanthoscelides obtectus]